MAIYYENGTIVTKTLSSYIFIYNSIDDDRVNDFLVSENDRLNYRLAKRTTKHAYIICFLLNSPSVSYERVQYPVTSPSNMFSTLSRLLRTCSVPRLVSFEHVQYPVMSHSNMVSTLSRLI